MYLCPCRCACYDVFFRKIIRMNRSSLIHYIAPSAIGITPNVNNSANDLEVYIAQGCKIQVYCPRVGLDFDAATNKPQEWTLKGRNRRLVSPKSGPSPCPYTIYARLPKNDKGAGYLVFAPKDFLGGKWVDKYVYVTDTTASGLTKHGYDPVTDEWWPRFKDNENWYFKLGDVSLPENNERTLTIDTGLLGTEEFNNKWALNPDSMPLRIELQSTIADDQQPPVTRDGGTTPYVYWGETLILTALLTEGWTGTDIQRFDHWEIRRDSGDTEADAEWAEAINEDEGEGSFRSTGIINLIHGRGAETRDDFNSAVNTTFTVMAMERTDDPEAGGEPEYAVLKQASFCIMAEVWEGYELSADTLMVTFNPRNGQYSPSGNIKFRIRATDQKSEVFMMTNGQYAAAGLHAEYAPIDNNQNWTPITISGSESATAEGEVPATAFSTHQKSINVRLKNAAMKELDRFTIAFLKDGEDSREREWIYRLDTTAGYSNTTGTIGGDPSHPVSGQTGGVDNCRLVDDFVPENWTDEPTGTSSSHATEYASYRDYDYDNDRWGAFNTPKPWSHYGQDGDDGLYYKNEYARSKSRTSHAAADIDINYGTSGWDTTAPSATDTYPYIWKRTRQWNPNTNNWTTGSSWTYVCETGEDGPAGTNGDTPMQAFQWNQSATVAPSPLPSGGTLGSWSATAPNRPSGEGEYFLWMTQTVKHISANGAVTYDNWSTAVRISGNNGTNGEDGTDYEYIYILKTTQYTFPTNEKPANISTGEVSPGGHAASGSETDKQKDDWVPNGWLDNPQGIDSTNKFEYMSLRTKPKGSNTWGTFSDPFIWSHWGRNGMDGNGTEYVFIRTKNNVPPVMDSTQSGYTADEFRPTITAASQAASDTEQAQTTDDPKGTNGTYQYEWVAKRNMNAPDSTTGQRTWKKFTGENNDYKMSLWSNYAEDGKNSIRLALDNEHEDFLYSDSQALPIAPSGGATSAIHLYDGPNEVTLTTSMLSIDSSTSGVPTTGDNVPTIITDTDGKIKLKVPHITAGTAKVVVKCTYNGHNYFAEFTANKTSQDKCDLYVRPNAIPYNPASYTPMTLAFEAERTDLQGNKTSATISTSGSGRYVAGNLYLFFGYVKADGSIVNPTGGSTLYEWADIPVAASVCSAYVGIYFELRLYTSASAYRMCDHETVEIAKTQNGANAPYYVMDYGRASSRSLNQQGTPSGFDSTTGWQNTAPATSNNFPYIWERSRYYNSAGTLQSTSYTCLTGETGDDGISVFTDPTNILIRQVAKPQGNTREDFGLPMDVGFAVKEGKTDGTVTDVYIKSASGLTVIRNSDDHTKAQITDVVPTGTVYPDKGHFTCRVSYTINGTSKQVDVKVPVYIDLMGGIVTTIKGDVEQTVAHDIGYAIDPSGGIQSLDQVGNYIRSASEMTSELSKKVGEGKNLLTGVLTGEGWQLLHNTTRTNIETDDEDKFVIPSGYYLVSPDHNYSVNDGYYVLSYEAPAHATIGFYDIDDNPIDVPRTRGSVNGRRYIIFNTVWEDEGEEKSLDTDVVIRFSGVSYIRHPQLETGEVATAFEAGTSETSSRIHQTAEQIEELVNDTGVNIVDKTIDLYADKVKFYKNKSAAQQGDPAKIWIDGGDGSLHAVDGHFEGTVRATNFYHNVCIFTEGVLGGAVGYSYSKYYCTSAPEDYSFQQGKYYTAEEIIAEIGSIPSTNFAQCVYDADVVHMIPTSGSVTGANWGPGLDDGKKTVTLPDPADFEGKIIEVYCDYYGDRSAGAAYIDCVQPGSFASHMHLGTDGNTLSVSWQANREIVEGGVTVRFLSIEAYYDQTGETKHRWLIMGTSYDYPILEQLLQAHFDNRYQRLP